MAEYDRAAALYRQRMAQQNSRIGVESPPAMRKQVMNPHMTRLPPPQAQAPPPGSMKSVKGMTNYSRKIVPKEDPAQGYHNLKRAEYQGGEDTDMKKNDTNLTMLSRIVCGVMITVGLSAIFVLPKPLKVFWVIVVGLTGLMWGGFCLYKELMEMGKKDGEENKKYAQWASMILYALTMLYSAVMVGILFFMAWSLYSIANSQTNLGRLDRAAMAEMNESRMRKRAYA